MTQVDDAGRYVTLPPFGTIVHMETFDVSGFQDTDSPSDWDTECVVIAHPDGGLAAMPLKPWWAFNDRSRGLWPKTLDEDNPAYCSKVAVLRAAAKALLRLAEDEVSQMRRMLAWLDEQEATREQ